MHFWLSKKLDHFGECRQWFESNEEEIGEYLSRRTEIYMWVRWLTNMDGQ